ncbi:MAG: zinc transporter ZupT [Campylobacterales bacterium]
MEGAFVGFFDERFNIALFLTLLAGLSTALGAAVALFVRERRTGLLAFGLGFSAGVMLYVSFVEILPGARHAFEALTTSKEAEMAALLAFFGGMALTFAIDWAVPDEINPHELKNSNQIDSALAISSSSLKKTGIVTALALALHNFPEGFATFVASMQSSQLGIMIALAVAIHNIPEGMAVALPLYYATGERRRAFYYAMLSGLAEPVGALAGYFLLYPLLGPLTLGVVFGGVAGVMVYVSLDELMPAARTFGYAHLSIIGVMAGMGVMALSLLLLN